MKQTVLSILLFTIIFNTYSQESVSSLNVFGNNSFPSVNGFLNKIEFTGGRHGALVFHPNEADELMFGLHTNGNFYWGTGRNATNPDFYSMYLNGNNGNLTLRGNQNTEGITTSKALSVSGNNAKASVNGFLNKIEFTGGRHGAIVFHPNEADELMFGLHTNGNFYWGTGRNATNPDYYSMFLNGNNGNLGIRGKLTSNEVQVKVGGWADFVFSNNYKLPSLQEVENHIKDKGHLKDIPTTKEVVKNGILLGEMNAKLLQKIEELTLYIIDINKEVATIKKENRELKTQEKINIELMKRLTKLESKLLDE